MGAKFSLHIPNGEHARVETSIGKDASYVTMNIITGGVTMEVFFKTIEDVERIAFEATALAMRLRDEHGWGHGSISTVELGGVTVNQSDEPPF